MARYIDAEALYKILNERNMLETYKDYMAVNRAINDTPTADVVPKSELNRYKMCSSKEDYQNKVARLRQREAAMEIFEEIDTIYSLFDDDDEIFVGNLRTELKRIKKKYTEEHHEIG